jgi:hypothetical protein
MGQRFAAFTLCTAAMTSPAWPADHTVSSQSGKSVLSYFEEYASTTIDELLAQLRPTPLDAAARAEVIAALPKEGELRPKPSEIAKLEAAEGILAYHDRQGVIIFKVIDVNHAFVGLHARSVLLASRDALSLVSADEFAALVAHEIAHEYVWDEYWQAMQRADHPRMQELELRCDGIAVLTMRRLGLDPERLVSAVQKMTRFNQHRGTVARAADYVSLKERVAFIRAMETLAWPGGNIDTRTTADVVSPPGDLAPEDACHRHFNKRGGPPSTSSKVPIC